MDFSRKFNKILSPHMEELITKPKENGDEKTKKRKYQSWWILPQTEALHSPKEEAAHSEELVYAELRARIHYLSDGKPQPGRKGEPLVPTMPSKATELIPDRGDILDRGLNSESKCSCLLIPPTG